MTPLEQYPELAKKIGIKSLYFKREDLHKYLSHKGRSLPVMIDHYIKNGSTKFAISSSGNAAIASALYINEINSKLKEKISLYIFIGQNISKTKENMLKELEMASDGMVKVLPKERPLFALNQAIDEGYTSLRQSTDDIALLGYYDLAEELTNDKNIKAIFVGTSSGTTAQGLLQYFKQNNIDIQVHCVQTSSCHPISDQFENYDGPDEKSIADAIVAKTTERQDTLVKMLNDSGGYCWTVNNTDIRTAMKLSKDLAIDISPNSALSVAGLMQAVYRDWDLEGDVVCLITGQ